MFSSFDPVNLGHRDIDYGNVWSQPLDQGNGFLTVASFRHHIKIRFPFQNSPNAIAH
jgi:hypothetical protein